MHSHEGGTSYTAIKIDFGLKRMKHSDNDYFESLQRAIMDYSDLVAQARKDGYNAILGYKLTVVNSFDFYGGSIVNGAMGIGEYIVHHMGVPLVLVCK